MEVAGGWSVDVRPEGRRTHRRGRLAVGGGGLLDAFRSPCRGRGASLAAAAAAARLAASMTAPPHAGSTATTRAASTGAIIVSLTATTATAPGADKAAVRTSTPAATATHRRSTSSAPRLFFHLQRRQTPRASPYTTRPQPAVGRCIVDRLKSRNNIDTSEVKYASLPRSQLRHRCRASCRCSR